MMAIIVIPLSLLLSQISEYFKKDTGKRVYLLLTLILVPGIYLLLWSGVLANWKMLESNHCLNLISHGWIKMDISFLDKFLQQTKTTNLKTKDLYPDLINDLDVKVSFGMGTPTHVPWISTLGPGMSTSNGYYPVYLYYKKENILILAYGISETVDYEEPWTREIVDSNQKIKDFLDKPFRYGESYVFQTYVPEITETEVKYFRNEREISKEDIAKDLKDITNKYKECLDIEVKDEGSDLSKGLFYMESQLEDFIIQNWNESEFGKKYDLIIKDGELESQQYRTDIGPIDILATDKNTGEYVVIELKRNQTSDQTIGQIARYMQWVDENLNKGVKGVIVCGKWDEKLDYARKRMGDVEVLLYEVNFSLKEYKKWILGGVRTLRYGGVEENREQVGVFYGPYIKK